MAKQLTVFYSWQSDTPAERNRLFIENAIQESLSRLKSDAELEKALRDTSIELDRDIKNVAGSPPITDTILKKIEGCAVFIADLTFVGRSMEGLPSAGGESRLFPNPNVLIEYGYSLRSHSHSKIIGVMNTAYGKPDKESLPFDLRHMLYPIQYHLTPETSRDIQLEMLVQELVERIGLILQTQIPGQNADYIPSPFTPHKVTSNAAIFFESAEDLVFDRSGGFVVPEGGKMYLRLYPKTTVDPLNSELEAHDLAVNGNLMPLGKVNNYGYDRNVFGALVFESPDNGNLFRFTQLFLSREIWGCDAHSVNADRILHRFENQPVPYIVNAYVENCFVNALRNYLAFARIHLKLPLPLRIEAGLTGIKGYPITVNNFNIAGRSIRDKISWQAELSAYDKPAWEILDPFFESIWANCGVQRTAAQKAELVRRFTPPAK
jgi:hypothetical protein